MSAVGQRQCQPSFERLNLPIMAARRADTRGRRASGSPDWRTSAYDQSRQWLIRGESGMSALGAKRAKPDMQREANSV